MNVLDYVLTHGTYDLTAHLPLHDGEASHTETCKACHGIGARVSYVEHDTGAVIDVECPACGGYGIVEGITYSTGPACHDDDLRDLYDFEAFFPGHIY